jgi:hypothetical protein
MPNAKAFRMGKTLPVPGPSGSGGLNHYESPP